MTDAFANHVTSDSSMKMMGWQDSDGDGVFDVLDVDHTLVGTGGLTDEADEYRFVGYAAVNTLINKNSAGFQSDITLNEIDHVQFRFDDGDWTTAVMPGSSTAVIDFVVDVPNGAQNVTIRSVSVDDGTGAIVAKSNVFSGNLDSQSITSLNGIRGQVWSDLDNDEQWDAGEPGLSDIPVRIVDESGDVVDFQIDVEPDEYQDNNVLNTLVPGVTLSAIGSGVMDHEVFSRVRGQASTGSRVFAVESTSTFSVVTEWNTKTRMLKAEFDSPVSMVSIDAVADDDGDFGRLEIYDSSDNLLGRFTTKSLTSGESETMTLVSEDADIAYAIARAHYNTDVHLDNLVIGPVSQTQTGTMGEFWLPWLVPGTHEVAVELPTGWVTVGDNSIAVNVSEGESVRADFAVTPPPWHHADNPEVVNDDGDVVPLDALLVVNDLNANGSRRLDLPTAENQPPPYLDVNGDGSITPLDALRVINRLNDADSEGENASQSNKALAEAIAVDFSVEGETVADETMQNSDSAQLKTDFVSAEQAVADEQRPSLSKPGLEQWISRQADSIAESKDEVNNSWDDLLTSLAEDCLYVFES